MTYPATLLASPLVQCLNPMGHPHCHQVQLLLVPFAVQSRCLEGSVTEPNDAVDKTMDPIGWGLGGSLNDSAGPMPSCWATLVLFGAASTSVKLSSMVFLSVIVFPVP